MTLRIDVLAVTDHERWLELWREYQRFYAVDIPPHVTELTWARLHDGRIHGFGARDAAGRLQGIVHYLFHEDTWSTSPACYLEDLYVDAAARGAGGAGALMAAVAAAASAKGAAPPYWLTHESNARARRLYDRLAVQSGFIQYVFDSTR